MRLAHHTQPSLSYSYVSHPHAVELRKIASILDSLPELEARVLADLSRGVRRDFGRKGLSAQQVLRLFILYLLTETDFDDLDFRLADSPTYRSFCLLGLGDSAPKRSTLQENFSRLTPRTLEAIHSAVVAHAISLGVDRVSAVRTDTTPVSACLRSPNDAALLVDASRVLQRVLHRTQQYMPTHFPNYFRKARKRAQILRADKLTEEQHQDGYFELIQVVKESVESALLAADYLDGCSAHKAASLSIVLRTESEKALRICDQAHRRVLDKEKVPSSEKCVSMFETHADILCKRNQVDYGHKVCLTFGKSGLVLAAQLYDGNPADAKLAEPAIRKVIENTGRIPHDAAMDLGFASKDNVTRLKELGVQRVSFPSGRGIDGEKACGHRRIRRKLNRFRAGAEGLISWLKRSLSMGQSRWKGYDGFSSYVWGVILTACLQAIARAG